MVECYRKEVGTCVGDAAAAYRLRFITRFPEHSALALSSCGLDHSTWTFSGERCTAPTCNLDAAAACLSVDDITDPIAAVSEGPR